MTEQSTASSTSVYQKMARVMADIESIPQSGTHPQGWKYSTSQDVEGMIRKQMIAHGLVLIPRITGYEWIENRYIIRFEFTLVDADSGSSVTIPWLGESMAIQETRGGNVYPDDKAINKATTNAQKYFLKRTFLMASEDDADTDANDTRNIPARASSSPRTRSSQPATAPAQGGTRAAPTATAPTASNDVSEWELGKMRRDFFARLTAYFGNEAHGKTGLTRAARAGRILVWMAGADSSADLDKEALVSMLALVQGGLEKHGTARDVLAMWLKTAPPARPQMAEKVTIEEEKVEGAQAPL